MQTFLPYPSLRQTGMCLDYRRLGKQRVEAYQILNILTGKTDKLGWRSHPAVLMWKGYELMLGVYMDTMIDCWIERGYRNNMRKTGFTNAVAPPWFGSEALHASHRSNLLRKDPTYYGAFGWAEGPHLPYVWPVTKETQENG